MGKENIHNRLMTMDHHNGKYLGVNSRSIRCSITYIVKGRFEFIKTEFKLTFLQLSDQESTKVEWEPRCDQAHRNLLDSTKCVHCPISRQENKLRENYKMSKKKTNKK